jgi:septal ring factor EnvC (AmiA/AmiB activator)
MDVGDYVFQGDIIASGLEGKPLAFELRVDGRSIDPKGKLQSLTD